MNFDAGIESNVMPRPAHRDAERALARVHRDPRYFRLTIRSPLPLKHKVVTRLFGGVHPCLLLRIRRRRWNRETNEARDGRPLRCAAPPPRSERPREDLAAGAWDWLRVLFAW